MFFSSPGRKPASRQRDEHKDSRFRIQQWVHAGKQARHVLWKSSVRCTWALPGWVILIELSSNSNRQRGSQRQLTTWNSSNFPNPASPELSFCFSPWSTNDHLTWNVKKKKTRHAIVALIFYRGGYFVDRQEVRRPGSGRLEPRCDPLHARQRQSTLRRFQPEGAAGACPAGKVSYSLLHVNRLRESAQEVPRSQPVEEGFTRGRSTFFSPLFIPIDFKTVLLLLIHVLRTAIDFLIITCRRMSQRIQKVIKSQ